MKAFKKFTFFLVLAVALSVSCSKSDKNNTPVYPTNCAQSLAGLYTGSDICSGSNPTAYTTTVTANTPTNVTFSNLNGYPVTAVLDCSTNKITIPTQTFAGNISIGGTGTYTANRIIINWNGTSLGYPITCSTTYTR
jgi:hypothetical protein